MQQAQLGFSAVHRLPLYALLALPKPAQAEQHKLGGKVVAMDRSSLDEILRRTMARIGRPSHGELKVEQFVPDCSECQKWYERI